MAKVQSALDLVKNELQNARLQNLGSAPSSPVTGQFYFNSGDGHGYIWNGSAWVAMDGSSVSFGAVTAQTSFGGSSSNGAASTAARSDHTHGTPAHGAAQHTPGTELPDWGAVTAQTTFGASSGNGSASTGARSDHTHGTPAHNAAAHSAIPLSALAAAAADLTLGGFKITGLADPTASTDAATKAYVDAARAGLDVKSSVRAASTANVSVTYSATGGASTRGQITDAPDTLDGVSLATADRILLKNQTTGAQNGIYCVDPETEILTGRGWKKHNEVLPDDETLTFNMKTGLSEWQPILSIHRFDVVNEPMLAMENGIHSSLTTMNHRWPVQHIDKANGSRFEIRESRQLKGLDYILRAIPCSDIPVNPKFDDAFVELMGWFITEGHIRTNNSGTASTCVRIAQSLKNQANIDQIRACLTRLFGQETLVMNRPGRGLKPEWRMRIKRAQSVEFDLNSCFGKLLCDQVRGNKIPKESFIRSLTQSQLHLFVDTVIAGDGHDSLKEDSDSGGDRRIYQSSIDWLESLQLACSLLGISSTITKRPNGYGEHSLKTRFILHLHKRVRSQPHLSAKTLNYTGIVWCPKTANGTWYARRNGKTYFTGNTVTTVGTSATGVWDRATDFDSDAEVTSGAFTFINEGTVNDNTGWVLTTNDPIVIGGGSGTSLDWTKFTGVSFSYGSPGSSAVGDSANDGASSNVARADHRHAREGFGAVTALAYGDSSSNGSAATVARSDHNHGWPSGIVRKYAQDIGDGSTTAIVVTHNLNTRDVDVKVRDNSSPYEFFIVTYAATSVNTVTITFTTAPTTNQFRTIVFA